MTTQALPDLDQLTTTYDVVGELAGRDDARMYLARRREDGLDVLIVVTGGMAGDEGNALSHLAADANLLASMRHRAVLPVVEGRWVGPDSFALVLKRTNAPTLAELLNRRDEEFDYARVAAILRDVNGVLEWARAQKVVHRAVRPESLYVEPGTDHVQVAFAVTPLPANGIPGAERDGATIAALARAMLTRSPAAPEREAQPLAELRPGLPTVLLEETEQLLHPQPGSDARDVSGFIARVAMADALKAAQDKLEETRNLIARQEAEHKAQLEKERGEHDAQIATERASHEEQVAAERRQHEKEIEAARKEHEHLVAEQTRQLQREREQHDKQRADQQREFEKRVADQQRQFEKQVADQQRQFEKQVADEQKRFAKQSTDQQRELQRERDEHARLVAQQTKHLQREREEHERRVADQARKFQKEREALEREVAQQRDTREKERHALAQERAAHARDCAVLLEERAAHDHVAREERDRLATDAAALATQADLYAHTAELPVATTDVEVRFPRHLEREVEPPTGVSRDEVSADQRNAGVPASDPRSDAIAPAAEDAIEDVTDVEDEQEGEPTTRILASTDYRVPSLDLGHVREVGEPVPLGVQPVTSAPSVHDRFIAPVTAWMGAAWSRRPDWRAMRWRSSWNIPAAAIALVLLIGITVLALSKSGGARPRASGPPPARSTRARDSWGRDGFETAVPPPRRPRGTGGLPA